MKFRGKEFLKEPRPLGKTEITMSDNMQIYSRLAELAREYFLEISGEWKPGTYSAMQAHEMLVEKKNGLKAVERTITVKKKPKRKEAAQDFICNVRYQVDGIIDVNRVETYRKTYSVYNSGKQLSVEAGSFKASFDACKVFYYLTKFETLANVLPKERIVFARQEEHEDAVLSFDVTVTREMASLAACVGDDELRPIMGYIHIDVDNQCAVASDGHILSVYPMSIAGMSDSKMSDHKVVLVPKEMMKDSGTYHICQYRKDISEPGKFTTIATKIDGRETMYRIEQSLCTRYPNYQSVIPPVHKGGYMKLKNQQDVKALFAFLKNVKGGQRTGVCVVKVYGKSYDNRIYFSHEDRYYNKKNEVSFETESMIQHSFYFGINALMLLKVRDWTGGLWHTSPSRSFILDDKHAHLFLITPVYLEDYQTKGLECTELTDARYKNDLAPYVWRNNRHPMRDDASKQLPPSHPQKQQKQDPITIQPPVQEPEFISMEANKYAYYYLPDMAEGKYEVRGASDPETKLAITSMAHYILNGGMLQPECVSYVRKVYGCDKERLSKRYPLSENDLAALLMEFLETKGIEDIPEYPERKPVIAPAVEQSHVKSAEVKPAALEREIEPFIELETDEGTLLVAAESYFEKLYDSKAECFRSEAARVKFDEIDAFITDELVYERPLRIEAIAEEVERFLQAADSAV